MISSRLELNLYLIWLSLVPIPVWIRLCLAYFKASAAQSISFSTARVRAQIVGQVTALEISTTELKSPGLEIGKPASITSTPSSSNCFATWIFSTVFNWHPGTCSPSRRVVSKINNLSLISISFFIILYPRRQPKFLTKKPFTLLYGSGKAYYIIIHELYAYLITSAYILQSKSNNNAANVQCFNCHNS